MTFKPELRNVGCCGLPVSGSVRNNLGNFRLGLFALGVLFAIFTLISVFTGFTVDQRIEAGAGAVPAEKTLALIEFIRHFGLIRISKHQELINHMAAALEEVRGGGIPKHKEHIVETLTAELGVTYTDFMTAQNKQRGSCKDKHSKCPVRLMNNAAAMEYQ